MNYLSTVTIGDFIGPEFMACLGILEEDTERYTEFLSDEQAAWTMGGDMSQSQIWDRLWRFGIIVNDDLSYYIPDDYNTELELVEFDGLFKEIN